jgi:hypothetical protein
MKKPKTTKGSDKPNPFAKGGKGTKKPKGKDC